MSYPEKLMLPRNNYENYSTVIYSYSPWWSNDFARLACVASDKATDSILEGLSRDTPDPHRDHQRTSHHTPQYCIIALAKLLFALGIALARYKATGFKNKGINFNLVHPHFVMYMRARTISGVAT